MKRPNEPGLDTRAVHGPHLGATGAMSTPIVHSATFSFESLDAMAAAQAAGSAGAFYQRDGHPTIHAVEDRLAALDGAEAALLFPSGMGAISATFLATLKSGDHVVCVDPCYGGTQALLQWGKDRLGWSHTFVDSRRPDTWPAAFQPSTRLLHLESPINPTLVCFDIAAAARLGHERGALVTIDNTIASPIGQQPLAMGCDLTLYSATKSLGGHSDLLAGVACGSRAALAPVWKAREVFGPIAEPTMAWMLERSLKTLALRVRAGNANALELARRLEKHADVVQVFYPGLGLPSQPCHRREADEGGLRAAARLRGARRRGRGAAPGERAPGHPPRGEPRRRGVAGEPRRAHVAQDDRRGGPQARRHSRGTGASLGRHREHRRPVGGPGAGAREGRGRTGVRAGSRWTGQRRNTGR
jgi:cystathionine gamma-synthase/methionine-gamma-lyase